MRELDLSKEEDKIYLEQCIFTSIRNKMVARQMFPVMQVKPEWMKRDEDEDVSAAYLGHTNYAEPPYPLMPVIHKEMIYNPDTVEKDIAELTTHVANSEDRLLFSGETTGWPALGIEGLSTATGRHIMAASGSWSCLSNLISDLISAKEMLGAEPGVLIIPWGVNRMFHETYWYPDSLDKEPLTVKNYLLKEKIVDGIYSIKNLYAGDGGVDSALLIHPGVDNFYAVQDLPMEVKMWINNDGVYDITLRETIAPVIKKPASIVEIELIHGNPPKSRIWTNLFDGPLSICCDNYNFTWSMSDSKPFLGWPITA